MSKRIKRVLSMTAALAATLALCSSCNGGEAETTTTTTVPSTTVVTTTTHPATMNGEVNVRSGPGFEHPSLGGIAAGTDVVIVGREGDWYMIEYDGGYGYISAHYVDVSGASNASQMIASRVTAAPTEATTTTKPGQATQPGGTTLPGQTVTAAGTTTTTVAQNGIPDTQVDDAF